MSLSALIKSTINILASAAADLDAGTTQVNSTHVLQYSDGAGAGQANVQFTDRRTLAASASENLDLAGSLANLLGAAVFARVKYIRVNVLEGALNFSRPASNGLAGIFLAAGDGVSIPAGGKFEWGDPGATGIAVVAGTGDLLTAANPSGAAQVIYEIVIVGASA